MKILVRYIFFVLIGLGFFMGDIQVMAAQISQRHKVMTKKPEKKKQRKKASKKKKAQKKKKKTTKKIVHKKKKKKKKTRKSSRPRAPRRLMAPMNRAMSKVAAERKAQEVRRQAEISDVRQALLSRISSQVAGFAPMNLNADEITRTMLADVKDDIRNKISDEVKSAVQLEIAKRQQEARRIAQVQAATKIQAHVRGLRSRREFVRRRAQAAALRRAQEEAVYLRAGFTAQEVLDMKRVFDSGSHTITMGGHEYDLSKDSPIKDRFMQFLRVVRLEYLFGHAQETPEYRTATRREFRLRWHPDKHVRAYQPFATQVFQIVNGRL